MKCEYCGKEPVKKHRKYRKYCNLKCRNRHYYLENKEKISLRRYKQRKENPEKYNEIGRKNYQNRKDMLKKRRDNRSDKEKIEVLDKQKEYIKKNKYKRREYNRKYQNKRYKNDIEFNIKRKLSNSFNVAIKKYIKNSDIIFKKEGAIDYYNIIEHLKPFPKDINNYHIDHIIPLSFFDLNNEEQVRLAWNPINLQWLDSKSNIIKSNNVDFIKYPIQKEVYNKLRL